jgi:hypothetical protein
MHEFMDCLFPHNHSEGQDERQPVIDSTIGKPGSMPDCTESSTILRKNSSSYLFSEGLEGLKKWFQAEVVGRRSWERLPHVAS